WASWLRRPAERPELHRVDGPSGTSVVAATHPGLGTYYLACEAAPHLLFTENETNNARLFSAYANATPYVKDGINDYVVNQVASAINPSLNGTKVAAHYQLTIGGGESATIRLRLSNAAPLSPAGRAFDEILENRRREADEFYADLTPAGTSADGARVLR